MLFIAKCSLFIDEQSEIAMRGHDRASEETKGLIPRGLPRKAASNRRFEAAGTGLCPAV